MYIRLFRHTERIGKMSIFVFYFRTKSAIAWLLKYATGLTCVQTSHVKSFFLSGGVREKRVECKRSCVSLMRLFTWRIRKGGSRQEMEGREVNKPAKARLLLWRARSSIVCVVERAFQNVPSACLPDKRSRGKKRSGQEGDRYHEPDSVDSFLLFFSFSPSPPCKDAHSNVHLIHATLVLSLINDFYITLRII